MSRKKETYSLYKIFKEGLLLNRYGLPYKTESGLRKRLREFGHEPIIETTYGKAYAITDKDIEKMNNCG